MTNDEMTRINIGSVIGDVETGCLFVVFSFGSGQQLRVLGDPDELGFKNGVAILWYPDHPFLTLVKP
jgi:hypothetical protein